MEFLNTPTHTAWDPTTRKIISVVHLCVRSGGKQNRKQTLGVSFLLLPIRSLSSYGVMSLHSRVYREYLGLPSTQLIHTRTDEYRRIPYFLQLPRPRLAG